ncbi:MAG: endonuclease/exonuclease/phosphatase family protein [Candidatus Binatia bacterium]
MPLLTVASYNIHQCIGRDGQWHPGRVARVLQELEADIVGLQEVHSRPGGSKESYQMKYLADVTGFEAVGGTTMQRANSEYGNVLLSRHPIKNVRRLDLSVRGHEPRGALDAEVQYGSKVIRVIVSHLGLGLLERRHQMRNLLEALDSDESKPCVLLMDHNEWLPWGPVIRWCNDRFCETRRAVKTFPAVFPIFALDRIWVQPAKALVRVERYVSPASRMASDHLPVRGTVDVEEF